VKNKVGGNKSKNIGSKFTKKITNIPEPDFENSFFGEVTSKPNGMMSSVKILPVPSSKQSKLPYNFDKEFLRESIQLNIGKLKSDKRNSHLGYGDIVQVEINFDMKRKNGNTFAYILCKYNPLEVRQFKKSGLIIDEKLENDDFYEGLDSNSEGEEESEPNLNDL